MGWWVWGLGRGWVLSPPPPPPVEFLGGGRGEFPISFCPCRLSLCLFGAAAGCQVPSAPATPALDLGTGFFGVAFAPAVEAAGLGALGRLVGTLVARAAAATAAVWPLLDREARETIRGHFFFLPTYSHVRPREGSSNNK